LVFDFKNDKLIPYWQEIDSPEFLEYWKRQFQFLKMYDGFDPGYEMSQDRYFCINLYEEALLRELDRILNKGKIIIVDYGGTAQQLVSSDRFNLRMYPSSKEVHFEDMDKVMYDVDMTSDVNFTNVVLIAQSLGWQVEEFLPQGNFLYKQITDAEDTLINQQGDDHPWWPYRDILRLTKPSPFRVLVLSK
jgi:SAM-dependent MidA family methyltransferase